MSQLFLILRLAGLLIVLLGIVYLACFYFGVFQKSLANIYEHIARGYALIAFGLLLSALGFWFNNYQAKLLKILLVFLAKNQYIIYFFLAIIFIFIALVEYRKSLKEMQ